MKVTAETITDEQIRQLYADRAVSIAVCTDALSTDARRRYPHETSEDFEARKLRHADARAKCAEVWNARHGGEP